MIQREQRQYYREYGIASLLRSDAKRFLYALSICHREGAESSPILNEIENLLGASRNQEARDLVAELETQAICAARGISLQKIDTQGKKAADFEGSIDNRPFQVEVVNPSAKEETLRLQVISDTIVQSLQKIPGYFSSFFRIWGHVDFDDETRSPFFQSLKKGIMDNPVWFAQKNINLSHGLPLLMGETAFPNGAVKVAFVHSQLANKVGHLPDFNLLFPREDTVAFTSNIRQNDTCLCIFDKPEPQNNMINAIQRKVRNPQSTGLVPRIIAANVTNLPNAYEDLPKLLKPHLKQDNNWGLVGGFLFFTHHVGLGSAMKGYSYYYWPNPVVREPLAIPEIETFLRQ